MDLQTTSTHLSDLWDLSRPTCSSHCASLFWLAGRMKITCGARNWGLAGSSRADRRVGDAELACLEIASKRFLSRLQLRVLRGEMKQTVKWGLWMLLVNLGISGGQTWSMPPKQMWGVHPNIFVYPPCHISGISSHHGCGTWPRHHTMYHTWSYIDPGKRPIL